MGPVNRDGVSRLIVDWIELSSADDSIAIKVVDFKDDLEVVLQALAPLIGSGINGCLSGAIIKASTVEAFLNLTFVQLIIAVQVTSIELIFLTVREFNYEVVLGVKHGLILLSREGSVTISVNTVDDPIVLVV